VGLLRELAQFSVRDAHGTSVRVGTELLKRAMPTTLPTAVSALMLSREPVFASLMQPAQTMLYSVNFTATMDPATLNGALDSFLRLAASDAECKFVVIHESELRKVCLDKGLPAHTRRSALAILYLIHLE
jgi:hypothetical protein